MAENMDLGFHVRFKTVLERVGQLQRAAELTDMSTDQIAKWRDGRARPPFAPIAILCREAGVSLDWLAYDVGDPEFSGETKTATPVADVNFVLVPIYDIVASAGSGTWNERVSVLGQFPFDIQFLRKLGVDPERVHMIRARGDSMLPTIVDGALIGINTADQRLLEGEIYALVIDDQARIKRVQPSFDGGITLMSDNRDMYPPEKLRREDKAQLQVAGRVFWTEKVL